MDQKQKKSPTRGSEVCPPPRSGLCQHGHQVGPEAAPSLWCPESPAWGCSHLHPCEVGGPSAGRPRCLPTSLCRSLCGFSVETLPPADHAARPGGHLQGLCALSFGAQAAAVCAGPRGVQELPDPQWQPLEREGRFRLADISRRNPPLKPVTLVSL